ncbi:MAG: hypothetical protein ACKOEM_17800 [Planctomycetia bacterium]
MPCLPDMPRRRDQGFPVAALLAMIAGHLAGGGLVAAEEPPLSRIAPLSGQRVDPMRPTRLSVDERDQLYKQVQRDAEILERQSTQPCRSWAAGWACGHRCARPWGARVA